MFYRRVGELGLVIFSFHCRLFYKRVGDLELIIFSFHCRLFYKRVGELGLIIFGCVFGGAMYTFQAISSTTTMIFLCAYHSSSVILNLVQLDQF